MATNFCAGEARFAQFLWAEFQHFLRGWRAAVAAERFDAGENCGGGFAGDGLIGDGFHQRFVGAVHGFHFDLEFDGFFDEASEALVFCGERCFCDA